MNIGFIGTGKVAQPHLQNLSQMEGVRIGAVCDIDAQRAQSAASTFGATPYSDYREMLQTEKLDACYVCILPAAHGTIELELAQAKIPFYVEKPVHLDLDACQRVIDELDKTGAINSAGYHLRYTAAARAAREFTEAHRVSLVEGRYFGNLPGTPWWRRMALSGGQLVEQTTHTVDLARYLAGEVHTVFAIGSTGAMQDVPDYDIHDSSICTLLFDSGAIGQISSSCITAPQGAKTGIDLKGREWTLQLDEGIVTTNEAGVSNQVPTCQTWQEQLGNGDRAFVAAVQSNDAAGILSPYRSAAQTLAITLAANESMVSGRPVKVRRFV